MVSKNPPSKRDYKKEARYEDTPAQIAHREDRNRARATETKRLGHSPSGDVAHIVPAASGGKGTPGNIRVESVHRNRSWRGGRKGYSVPVDK